MYFEFLNISCKESRFSEILTLNISENAMKDFNNSQYGGKIFDGLIPVS